MTPRPSGSPPTRRSRWCTGRPIIRSRYRPATRSATCSPRSAAAQTTGDSSGAPSSAECSPARGHVHGSRHHGSRLRGRNSRAHSRSGVRRRTRTMPAARSADHQWRSTNPIVRSGPDGMGPTP
jgi:hypothetical protein